MTNWKMVAADFRRALHTHAEGCEFCDVIAIPDHHGGAYVARHAMVSDQCRHGSMLLSEIVIADIQAEAQAIKKMHGGVS